MSHVSPEIQKLIDRGNVTSAELKEIRCNSWEWQALVPAMTNEALLDRTRHALDNSTPPHRPASTYDEAVIGVFAPVLMERLAKATAEAVRHRERSALTYDELRQACKNIGFDLTCGACGELFFTGSTSHSCDATCFTQSEARGYAEVIDNVREALGQDATHYLIVADDVRELVRAVERQGGHALQVLQKIRRGPSPDGWERTPDGHINNCSLANGDVEKNCQICNGECPDRSRYA